MKHFLSIVCLWKKWKIYKVSKLKNTKITNVTHSIENRCIFLVPKILTCVNTLVKHTVYVSCICVQELFEFWMELEPFPTLQSNSFFVYNVRLKWHVQDFWILISSTKKVPTLRRDMKCLTVMFVKFWSLLYW